MATTRAIDITGQTFGRLTVIERVSNIGKHPVWLCACTCGNQKAVQGRHLKSGDIASCGCWRAERAAQVATDNVGSIRTDTPTYSGVHMRLRSLRGPASGYECRDCGRPADDWSYTGNDPEELKDARFALPYSVRADFYEPRCKSCHKLYDNAMRGAA